jgi:hypothetical protein
MLIPIHAEITQKALSGIFTPKILDKVIQANQKQDGLQGQIGHPEFHFDDNKMIAGFAYIQHQRSILLSSLQNENMNSAWQAFGRLLHRPGLLCSQQLCLLVVVPVHRGLLAFTRRDRSYGTGANGECAINFRQVILSIGGF